MKVFSDYVSEIQIFPDQLVLQIMPLIHVLKMKFISDDVAKI